MTNDVKAPTGLVTQILNAAAALPVMGWYGSDQGETGTDKVFGGKDGVGLRRPGWILERRKPSSDEENGNSRTRNRDNGNGGGPRQREQREPTVDMERLLVDLGISIGESRAFREALYKENWANMYKHGLDKGLRYARPEDVPGILMRGPSGELDVASYFDEVHRGPRPRREQPPYETPITEEEVPGVEETPAEEAQRYLTREVAGDEAWERILNDYRTESDATDPETARQRINSRLQAGMWYGDGLRGFELMPLEMAEQMYLQQVKESLGEEYDSLREEIGKTANQYLRREKEDNPLLKLVYAVEKRVGPAIGYVRETKSKAEEKALDMAYEDMQRRLSEEKGISLPKDAVRDLFSL